MIRLLRRGVSPDRAALIDTLRRLVGLLDCVYGPDVGDLTDYWYEERDYIVAVARRQLRGADPGGATDGAVR